MNGVIEEVNSNLKDYTYERVCGAMNEGIFPIEFEINRSHTGTIKNQQDVGACVAEVIAQIAEYLWARELDKKEEMSEGFVYGTFRNDTMTGSGLSVSSAMDYWKKIGTVPKKLFDILEEMPELKKKLNKFPELMDIAKKYCITGYVNLSSAVAEEKDRRIKDALTRYGYGLVAVSNKYFGESHCIMLTGWNDSKNTYKFKNSWGSSYGDNGFSELPKKEVNRVYLPLLDEIKLPFVDVNEDAWYYKAVKSMYFSDIMNGTAPDRFDPDKPLTRAEMATVLDRYTDMLDERFSNINKVFNEKVTK